ncbi:MAG: ATP-binding protein [Frankia sp.]
MILDDGAARPDPATVVTVADFVGALRALKAWSGDPSYDELRRRTGIPRSTLAEALSHRRGGLPTLDVVRRLLAACRVPPAEAADWKRAWRRVRVVGISDVGPPPSWHGPRPLLTGLVGRDLERAALADLVERRRLTTLVGPAGVGKTSLALQVADDAAPPDGVAVVALAAARDAGDVIRELAMALGVRGQGPEQLWTGIVRRLDGRRVLLVFDNCEQVADGCAQILRRLLPECPSATALVTSRRVLGVPEEFVRRLEPLAVPRPDRPNDVTPAVALFLARAGEAAPHRLPGPGDREAVASICRRLDGLPLALELAAARLRTLPVRELAARLDVDLGVLRSVRPGVDGRHDTLEAAVDCSHRLLPADAQRLLARLSVFRGGVGLAAIEAVCSAPPLTVDLVVPALATLVDHSMVQLYGTGPARYRLLQSVREYAARRLAAVDETGRTRDRLLDEMLATFRRGAGTAHVDARLAF